MGMSFKCKCLTYINQKTTGVWIMSGTWKVHDSLTNRLAHKGLHRVYYEVVNVDEWLKNTDWDKEDNYFVKEIRRVSSNSKYSMV